MLHKIIRWLPIEISLVTLSCIPQPAHPSEGYLYLGTGTAQSIVSGDVNNQFTHQAYHLGTAIETEDWHFSIDSVGATDNSLLNYRLLAEYGNQYIKIGTGFIGVQSSIPTQAGVIAGFYSTANYEDTTVSATTIPVTLRLSPYRSQNVSVTMDAYYGLTSKGSLTIPIETIIPGRPAYLTTESQKTGGTYGASAMIRYRVAQHVWLLLTYQKQYGKLDASTARITSDPLGITQPVAIPDLSFNNELILLSLTLN